MKPIIHQVQQRSPEWFEVRLGKVTASRAKDVMAFTRTGESTTRKNYREDLVGERLTGQQANPDQYINYEMKWGIVNEDFAKMKYQLASKNVVVDAPFFQHPELMCGVSPDGLVGEEGEIEIKCPRSSNHLFKSMKNLEVPEEYIPQIQMQLWITNRKWCDFISFDPRLPRGLDMFVQRVNRDDEYIAETLEPAIKRFLEGVEQEEKYFRNLLEKMPKN